VSVPEPVDDDAVTARIMAAIAARQPHRMVPDLSRMTDLVEILGDPQRAFPSVHITGTNGKTTTARMIDALLREFGLHTGRYTSPHLTSVTERICLDGTPIAAARLGAVYEEVIPYVELVDQRHPERMTFFELLTALAFAAFADAPVDVGVIEVGLGGTWDATNVLSAAVAVVTSVDLDHTQLLGDTVTEIATEKAGIIHPGATAVLAPGQPEALDVLLARCAEVGGEAVVEGVHFGVEDRRLALGGQQLRLAGLGGSYDEIFLPLFGEHQAHNAAAALAAVEAFLGGGRGLLDIDVVRAGFASVRSPGRLEIVRSSPTILLDAAHNPAGARALAAALSESFAFVHLVGVLAVLADKDAAGILEALEPVLDELIVTETTSPRRLPAGDLAAIARDVFGAGRVRVVERLDEALVAAVELADEAAVGSGAQESPGPGGGVGVLVAGSVITVGDARTLLGAR
jgi:dihydrofolate synthase/folylpolyglutamate synthase